jgi:hypothetical protein
MGCKIALTLVCLYTEMGLYLSKMAIATKVAKMAHSTTLVFAQGCTVTTPLVGRGRVLLRPRLPQLETLALYRELALVRLRPVQEQVHWEDVVY